LPGIKGTEPTELALFFPATQQTHQTNEYLMSGLAYDSKEEGVEVIDNNNLPEGPIRKAEWWIQFLGYSG